eukprot:TRINITY_DN20578_c0_g1_i1.p1 TRINITY_DN20578_c0_g1~~TRINITY_DN20578_c0_g1_i1.p1  ORF type:complete len:433 (-),score=89.59 TRINITY_DN20578_c0_g1_i1:432-1730(-)
MSRKVCDSVVLRFYVSLELEAAVEKSIDFPEACAELASLLRLVYGSADKTLQARILQDTQKAVGQLIWFHGRKQVQAARSLLQAAESVLPKQRRAHVVAEFKQALLQQHRYRRRSDLQPQQQGVVPPSFVPAPYLPAEDMEGDDGRRLSGVGDVPEDVLRQVVLFLDAPSLACFSAVCTSWRSIGQEDALWEAQFRRLYGAKETKKTEAILSKAIEEGRQTSWKKAFVCGGINSRRRQRPLEKDGSWTAQLTSNRSRCAICHCFFWLPPFPTSPVPPNGMEPNAVVRNSGVNHIRLQSSVVKGGGYEDGRSRRRVEEKEKGQRKGADKQGSDWRRNECEKRRGLPHEPSGPRGARQVAQHFVKLCKANDDARDEGDSEPDFLFSSGSDGFDTDQDEEEVEEEDGTAELGNTFGRLWLPLHTLSLQGEGNVST